MKDAAKPRVLLAEDDPVSAAFLLEILRQFGCIVQVVANGEAALTAAREQSFDLLILDRSLPGLRGDEVLRTLRAESKAASQKAHAIATTAESDPEIHAALHTAGFARVLMKPLSAAQLRKALNESACANVAIGEAMLDDTTGLAASGSAEVLSALRGLFAAELDALAREFEDLQNDRAALRERLHRLRAACGFCGAVSLQHAAAELSDVLHEGNRARIEKCAAQFQRTLAATREALALR